MKKQTHLIRVALVALLFAGFAIAQAADAKGNWEKHCASCHGMDGKGKTKAGRLADVKDLSDPKYQDGFKDEQIYQQIKDGLKDQKGKERMKPFKDVLSDEEIKALIAYVRAFKK
jgi:cytochrome c6